MAIGAILAGASAAMSIIGGLASLFGGGDDRPSLGGPNTLAGGVAQGLASQFSSQGGNSNLGQIQKNIQTIGARLGLSPQGTPQRFKTGRL